MTKSPQISDVNQFEEMLTYVKNNNQIFFNEPAKKI